MVGSPTTVTEPGRTRRNEPLGTFIQRFPVLYDGDGRRQKAAKIIAVLRDFLGPELDHALLVEVGSSTGIIAAELTAVCSRVIAVDVDCVALRSGMAFAGKTAGETADISFVAGDACCLPLADQSVDVVICNQVYEHVDDQPGLLAEIFRVLRPAGICYFGIGTRHVVIEGHYRLPFLSWLPSWAADQYVKLRGRDLVYDVTLRSYRRLKRLVREFTVFDYTVAIIRHPEKYAARDVVRARWLSRIPAGMLRRLLPALPVHVWVLQRPAVDRQKQWICREE